MKLLLRRDRLATIESIFHFYYHIASNLHTFDAALNITGEWNLPKFIKKCVDEAVFKFGGTSKFEDPVQSIKYLLDFFDATVLTSGLKETMKNVSFEFRLKIAETESSESINRFSNLLLQIEDDVNRWYFDSFDPADAANVIVYASSETKIYTINSETENKAEIHFDINPTNFSFESFLNLPTDLLHEHLSHVYPYNKLKKELSKDSLVFDDGWMYFVAYDLYENRDYNLYFPIDNEYKKWFLYQIESKIIATYADVEAGFRVARSCKDYVRTDSFQRISQLLSVALVYSPDMLGYEIRNMCINAKTKEEILKNLGEILIKVGEELFYRKRFNDSISTFELANDIYSDENDKIFAVRGILFLQNNNFNEAEEMFDKALEINGLNSDALFGQSKISLKKQNAAKSLEYINMALQHKPYDKNLWTFLGQIYLFLGELSGVLDATNKALEIDPLFVPALQIQRDTFLVLEKKDDAEKINKILDQFN